MPHAGRHGLTRVASPPIEVRWRAYWQAREAGYDDAETYDRYLHPATRVPLAQVLAEHPSAAADPQG